MQRSDKLKIYIGRLFKIAVFAAVFVGINFYISKKIEPLTHKSHAMWEKYFAKTDIDTVVLGTSVAEMIDGGIVSTETGRSCVNMATPSQYYATSIRALTMAAEQNPVNTVVLMMGFDSLERDEDLTSTMSMEKALYYGAPKKEALPHMLYHNLKFSLEPRNMVKPDSINKWMSWPVNSTKSFAQIKINHEEEKYNPMVNLYVTDNPPSVTQKRFDRKQLKLTNELKGNEKQIDRMIKDIKSIDITDEALDELEQICTYCSDNNIRLVVAIAPHRSDYRSEFGEDYEKIDNLVKNFIEKRDCIYVNFDSNSDIRSFMPDEYFTDMEHVNDEGIRAASDFLSQYLNEL